MDKTIDVELQKNGKWLVTGIRPEEPGSRSFSLIGIWNWRRQGFEVDEKNKASAEWYASVQRQKRLLFEQRGNYHQRDGLMGSRIVYGNLTPAFIAELVNIGGIYKLDAFTIDGVQTGGWEFRRSLVPLLKELLLCELVPGPLPTAESPMPLMMEARKLTALAAQLRRLAVEPVPLEPASGPVSVPSGPTQPAAPQPFQLPQLHGELLQLAADLGKHVTVGPASLSTAGLSSEPAPMTTAGPSTVPASLVSTAKGPMPLMNVVRKLTALADQLRRLAVASASPQSSQQAAGPVSVPWGLTQPTGPQLHGELFQLVAELGKHLTAGSVPMTVGGSVSTGPTSAPAALVTTAGPTSAVLALAPTTGLAPLAAVGAVSTYMSHEQTTSGPASSTRARTAVRLGKRTHAQR